MRRGLLMVGLALGLGCSQVDAGEIVTSHNLGDARRRCDAAGMDSVVKAEGAQYSVTCVAQPPRLLLSKYREAAAVARCVRLGMDAQVEVRNSRIGVACVAR